MPDLTFTALSAKLPANSITSQSGDLLVSVKAVMGEANVALTDQKIGEFFSKLLDAASNAQIDHNAVATPKFRSYNSPVASAPFKNPTTQLYEATFTYTLSVNIPLNRDSVNAVETTATTF
jgi:hypothetical protein